MYNFTPTFRKAEYLPACFKRMTLPIQIETIVEKPVVVSGKS